MAQADCPRECVVVAAPPPQVVVVGARPGDVRQVVVLGATDIYKHYSEYHFQRAWDHPEPSVDGDLCDPGMT